MKMTIRSFNQESLQKGTIMFENGSRLKIIVLDLSDNKKQ